MGETNPLESAALQVASRYTGKEPGYSFDPTLIVTIISIITDILGNCLNRRTPEQVASAAKRLGIIERVAIMNACRDVARGREARKLYDAVCETCEGADESKVIECCQATQAMGAGL